MIDLGISKLALIAVVALVVVGPERLPKVARMAGNLMGRAQRYMSEVKSEVNKQVELEELKKMQEEAKKAMQDVQSTVKDMENVAQNVEESVSKVGSELTTSLSEYDAFSDYDSYTASPLREPKTNLRQGRDSWGVKRSAMPQWYKRSAGVKMKIQSGAARVKRHRRAATQVKAPKSFF